MTIYRWIILACWLVFILYWLISAAGAKRNLNRNYWWQQGGMRIIIVVLIILTLHIPIFDRAFARLHAYDAGIGTAMEALGAALCLLGIALAVWARVYLGRNWGMPMSRKENPELVTGGPYALIRHPIYTGVILAMAGSVAGESVFWAIPLILFGAYFIYSARKEEKLMTAEFPGAYSAYQVRTKMLIPFIL
ncbi:MAG TPA: isoprenylcysteine carboxylmethyltransferase family protein [Candidatus Paceibacterota bacterium]|nr:isoprenylcysteine carboxylmethyltransferase family protein [Candidatus Paceibacterota bacterium]